MSTPPETSPATAAAPPRRHVRLFFAVAIASLLGTFGIYSTLIGDSTPLIGVAEAASGAHDGRPVKLRGEVASFTGSAGAPDGMRIVLRPDTGGDARTVTVHYRGSVPDAFRQGRQIVVDGRLTGATFAATPDTLVTKCPSKYDDAPAAKA